MPSESVPASAVTVSQSLRVFHGRLRRRLQDASAVGDLTSAQASALARLAAAEPSSTSALAGAEKVRHQSMAETVATLEQRGLVRRERDPDDGRRQLLFLTAAGRAHGRDARTTRHEWLARSLAERLSERELAVVNEAMALLQRIVDE